jgi:hypothetical protein
LAVVMVNTYWTHMLEVLAYLAIVLTVCVTTATVALFCSVVFHKTSISLMTAYLVLTALFMFPLAVTYFAETFFRGTPLAVALTQASFTSPFAAAFALPIDLGMPGTTPPAANWGFFAAFEVFYLLLNGGLMAAIAWLFNVRWRLA